MTVQSLIINNAGIKTDAQGRFSLNSLHHASGGNPKHQPNRFLRSDRAQGVIRALEKEALLKTEEGAYPKMGMPPVAVVNDGRNNGTYVVKELVYSYAQWISPEFELKVNRAFDALMTQQPQAPSLDTDEALKMLVDSEAQFKLTLAAKDETLAAQRAQLAAKAQVESLLHQKVAVLNQDLREAKEQAEHEALMSKWLKWARGPMESAEFAHVQHYVVRGYSWQSIAETYSYRSAQALSAQYRRYAKDHLGV